MGWNIDHIKALSLGGSNHLSNLQPMQSNLNSSMGNTAKKRNIHKQ
jgi:5-methylcytosine-specific restriction endonuclease McrA